MGKLLELVRQTDSVPKACDCEDRVAVVREISTILDRLSTVEDNLSLETDEDLIDAGIYELKALNCRYTYYLKLAKRLGISGI